MPSLASLTEDTIEYECGYEGHVHIFPADWEFGGATGLDPRTDARWRSDTYTYFDEKIRRLHVTQVPLCDDHALDYFTVVAGFSAAYNPKWIQVIRADGSGAEMLPFEYNKETDEVFDRDEV